MKTQMTKEEILNNIFDGTKSEKDIKQMKKKPKDFIVKTYLWWIKNRNDENSRKFVSQLLLN